jgi:hypothetical protein
VLSYFAMALLDSIDSPEDLKRLGPAELETFAAEAA